VKILFQGGWKPLRNSSQSKQQTDAYCRALARSAVRENHTVVLTSNREFDVIVAEELVAAAKAVGADVKNHLMYMLAEGEQPMPAAGRVVTIPSRWLIEERTYAIRNTDALVAIGGGKGTFDCVEKAFLSNKPVFVATAIASPSVQAWRQRPKEYRFVRDGDAAVFDDVNVTAEEFFRNVFDVVNALSEIAYSRRVFIVHGHDLRFRDQLAQILRAMEFEPVILQDEANRGLTVIEKLERDTDKAGFAFVLYTPDDVGHAKGETAKQRARQNVIFEHGLLIGLLGRERTCAIISGDLEIPSDVSGMVHEQIDDLRRDALKIAKILKDAGYKVDASKLL
jgi:predicted nucleotide-binding protein